MLYLFLNYVVYIRYKERNESSLNTINMEEKQLVIRNKDIFSKIRVLLITLFKNQEKLKNTQKRDVKLLKQQYESGQIALGDLTEQELKEYNKLIESEMKEKAQKELYVYNLLMTAK